MPNPVAPFFLDYDEENEDVEDEVSEGTQHGPESKLHFQDFN